VAAVEEQQHLLAQVEQVGQVVEVLEGLVV
jgi:hypothetical protein